MVSKIWVRKEMNRNLGKHYMVRNTWSYLIQFIGSQINLCLKNGTNLHGKFLALDYNCNIVLFNHVELVQNLNDQQKRFPILIKGENVFYLKLTN